ncbi:MAG: hypothetical protein Fur0018_12150 [Anaerolineales bacterium]
MHRKHLFFLLSVFLLLAGIPTAGKAQTYDFSVPEETVHVYLENDGSLTLDYTITFQNAPKASPIDAVDIGLPTDSFYQSDIQAELDGTPIPNEYIIPSPYVTYGLALNLYDELAIQPGKRATLHVHIANVAARYYPDTTKPTYASFQFAPNWFGSEFVKGTTDLNVIFHMPPGVGPNDGVWHTAPMDFPLEPETMLDEERRVTYIWHDKLANAFTKYVFGLSLPQQYVISRLIFNAEHITLDVDTDGSVKVRYALDLSNQSKETPFDTLSINYETFAYYLDWGHEVPEPSAASAALNDSPLPPPEVGYGSLSVSLGSGLRPGESGLLEVIYTMPPGGMLLADWEHNHYKSALLPFYPMDFSGDWAYGNPEQTITFNLPAGINPDEVQVEQRYGYGTEFAVQTGNQQVTLYRQRGELSDMPWIILAMPRTPFAQNAVTEAPRPSLLYRLGINPNLFYILLFMAGAVGLGFVTAWFNNRRKRQYLPPSIKVTGHGIKRGLTAVEAAILLEQPVDRILSMILFSVVKKGAARIVRRKPLQLAFTSPPPEGLRAYEQAFLEAMKTERHATRRKALQGVIVTLVGAVRQSMKGFHYGHTKAYYKSIVQKAWAQVEAADTPEVQAQTVEEALPWTMLDDDFDDRSRRIFHTRPVYLPRWWSAYDPGTQGAAHSRQTGHPTGGTVPASPQGSAAPSGLPTLPGGEFAASVVGGIQSFSSQVVGDLTDFTSHITQKTNPVPVNTSSSRGQGSGGGGHSCACACACACAGCACACAGGGR